MPNKLRVPPIIRSWLLKIKIIIKNSEKKRCLPFHYQYKSRCWHWRWHFKLPLEWLQNMLGAYHDGTRRCFSLWSKVSRWSCPQSFTSKREERQVNQLYFLSCLGHCYGIHGTTPFPVCSTWLVRLLFMTSMWILHSSPNQFSFLFHIFLFKTLAFTFFSADQPFLFYLLFYIFVLSILLYIH